MATDGKAVRVRTSDGSVLNAVVDDKQSAMIVIFKDIILLNYFLLPENFMIFHESETIFVEGETRTNKRNR